jgi:hypothetical protein
MDEILTQLREWENLGFWQTKKRERNKERFLLVRSLEDSLFRDKKFKQNEKYYNLNWKKNLAFDPRL